MRGFPGSSAGKESACNAGDLDLIPRLGRSPGERKGYPFQYSDLENSMDYTVAKSQTQLRDFQFQLNILSTKSLTKNLITKYFTKMVKSSFPGYPKMQYLYKTTVKKVKVAQSHLTLCHPMGHSPPGFSAHGIL